MSSSSPFDEPPDEPGRLVPGSSPARPAVAAKKHTQMQETSKVQQEKQTVERSSDAIAEAIAALDIQGSSGGTKSTEPPQQPQKQEGTNKPADDAWRTLLRKSQGSSTPSSTPAASPARPVLKKSPGTSPGVSPRRRSTEHSDANAKVAASAAGGSARTPPRTNLVAASGISSRRSSAGSAGSSGTPASTPAGTPVGTPASEARRARRERRASSTTAGGGASHTATGIAAALTASTSSGMNSKEVDSPIPTPKRIAGVGGSEIIDPDTSLLKKRLEAEAEARAKSRSRSREKNRGEGGAGGSGAESVMAAIGMTTPVGTPRRGRVGTGTGGGASGGGDELDELVQRSDERRSRRSTPTSTPVGTPKGGGRTKKSAGVVADFSPSSATSASASSIEHTKAGAAMLAELDALVHEAESPDHRHGRANHIKGKTSEAAYDTRSIHDVPPSPPTPSSSRKGGKESGANANVDANESKVQEDVGALAQMLEEVNMDDIQADPDIELHDGDHDDDNEKEDDGCATWQPFATGAFASSGAAAAVEAATATTGASDMKPRGTIDPPEEEKEERFDNTAGRRRTQLDPPEQGDDVMSVAMFSVDGGEQANLFHSDPFAGNGGVVPAATDSIVSQDDAFAGSFAPADETGQDAPADEEDNEAEPYREDDAELGARLLTTSTSKDDDVDAEAGEESQADRIKRYNQRADCNSSSDEEEDESSDEDDGEEEQEEPQFQAMDDDDGSDDAGGHLCVRFEPSVLSSEHHPLPSRTLSADDDGASSIVASSVPPPPPPRRAADQLVSNLLAGKQSGASSSADAKANRSVPLIKPPPPEKMKAWASSKGLIPSNSDQPPPSTDKQLNLPAMEAAERALAEAKRQLGEPLEETPKEEKDVQSDPFSAAKDVEADSTAKEDDDKSSANTNNAETTVENEEVDEESVQNDEANEEQIRSHVPVTTKVPVEKETAEDRARLAAKFASKFYACDVFSFSMCFAVMVGVLTMTYCSFSFSLQALVPPRHKSLKRNTRVHPVDQKKAEPASPMLVFRPWMMALARMKEMLQVNRLPISSAVPKRAIHVVANLTVVQRTSSCVLPVHLRYPISTQRHHHRTNLKGALICMAVHSTRGPRTTTAQPRVPKMMKAVSALPKTKSRQRNMQQHLSSTAASPRLVPHRILNLPFPPF